MSFEKLTNVCERYSKWINRKQLNEARSITRLNSGLPDARCETFFCKNWRYPVRFVCTLFTNTSHGVTSVTKKNETNRFYLLHAPQITIKVFELILIVPAIEGNPDDSASTQYLLEENVFGNKREWIYCTLQ